MDASVKVRVSGRSLAEAVAQYLEARLAPGCRVLQVWTVPDPDEDEGVAFDVEVDLSGARPRAGSEPAEVPVRRQRDPEPDYDEPDGPQFEEAEVVDLGEDPPEAPPRVRAAGDRLREAPSLEAEELDVLQEVDPVAAKRARRAKANRRLLLRREDRRADG